MRPVPQPVGTKYGVPGKMWACGHHTGIDFLAPVGTPAEAASPGTVVIAGSSSHYSTSAYGRHVVIRTIIGSRTYEILYAHLSVISVKVGQHVKLGQVIGKTGATGNVSGPHLHFEVRVSPFRYGNDVNPNIALNVAPAAPAAPRLKAPRKSLAKWAVFKHLSSRLYMDYDAALTKASKRRKPSQRGVDIDVRVSAAGTAYAFHWRKVGSNHLHDPLGKIGPETYIDNLHDEEIDRLRGPKGQKPHKLEDLLERAARIHVRVEAELKAFVPEATLRGLLANPSIEKLNDRGQLQFKTLALIPGAARRLRPVRAVGATSILSFTDYAGKGLSKADLWPVTDYVRGKAKWV